MWGTRLFGLTVAVLFGSGVAWGAGAPKQGSVWLQLKLDALGFPGVSNVFLESGASMLTVHFLDDSHLLVTFSLRKLVQRVQNDPETDDDREVAAEVVDLPSGKVEARTEWHMHDHARYLWSLGGGSFLVRIGDRLYSISPLARLGSKDPFERTVIPARPLRPSAVMVAPDGGLVTVQTVVRTALQAGPTTVLLGDDDAGVVDRTGTKTLIDFYRVKRVEAGLLEISPAGTIQSPLPLQLPVDSDGLLWATAAENETWRLTFDEFGGKTIPLGKLESSCMPRLQMLARGEFLALSCRGADDRIRMASFGLDGKETWEESVGDMVAPVFAYAPAAARFAVSHTLAADVPITAGMPAPPAQQEVRVYQNASGDMLLHVDCSPVMKSAENFDLSADGLLAVVVRNGSLVVYKLPPLSSRDREDIAAVSEFAPPAVTEGKVTLGRLTTPARAAPVVSTAPQSVAAAQAQADAGLAPAPPVKRNPPTLLNPGEKPEFGTANEPPKTPPQ
jgi:hypothetical protein